MIESKFFRNIISLISNIYDYYNYLDVLIVYK